ncbi:MAG: hypothetical protein JWM46_920 [Candidatus Kaiserbacteria bacterium]|nr:hypothetical protein [Candidatus Kaiserbacteria bacterium]
MFALALLACALFVPVFARAQRTDLQSTIRAAIAADPRTQGMSSAQVDAMVDALSQKAQSQGMTPNDITWRPVPDTNRSIPMSCGAFPTILCTLSYSLGFIGTGSTIPAWLFFASLLMIILILLLRRQHFLHARAMAAAAPKQ